VKEGATVTAYDPEAMNNVKNLIGDKIAYAENEYTALLHADALVICTEWGVFRNPDFNKVGELMSDKVVFDGRNLFDLSEMNEKGFYYNSIGRKTIVGY
jgi:UDPglucose 6-dehydrogenase